MDRRLFLLLTFLAIGCGQDPIQEMIVKLDDTAIETRRNAARSLAQLGAEAAPAVDALVVRLADDDAEVRRLSGYALGCLCG